MYLKKLLLGLFTFGFISYVSAQDEVAIRQYIETYKEIAIKEMQRSGVPASIKLAQGIHETFAGQSDLVLKSNNHFGIKCKSEWTGESVKHDDDARNECFRKYSSAVDSYRDHSDFLRGSDRYSFLFKLDPTDYSGWAYGLKRAGYATNPRYASIIIKLIEDFNLQDYTLIAMGKMKEPSVDFAKNEIIPAEQSKEVKDVVVEVKKAGPAQPEKRIEEVVTIKEQEKPGYPSGEFKINDTRVVFVSKGASFLSIAEQYNIPLARIFEFNDMKQTEAAEKDQLIYLMRKRKTGNNEFHTVMPGESLYDIAQEEAIRIESLLEYNFLATNHRPAIGEKLALRTKATGQPRLALDEMPALNMYARIQSPENKINAVTNSSVNEKVIEHKVAPRETIYSIAQRYNVKIDDILKWNNLSGYDLKMGQQLKIYKH